MIAYLLGEFPSLTETFIQREIEELARQGRSVLVFALQRPATAVDSGATGIEAYYPPPLGSRDLMRAIAGVRLRTPWRSTVAWARFWRLAARQPRLLARVHRLAPQACWCAQEMRRRGVTHLHAHFASYPTTVALLAAALANIPFSFTGHARDLFVRDRTLREKVLQAKFVVTCTRFGAERLATVVGPELARKIRVIYHGLPLDEFPLRATAPSGVPMILAVGRLVEKKGFSHLLRAVALLRDRGIDFQCRIAGEGPERGRLETLITEQGLGAQVTLLGAQTRDEVRHLYEQAAVLVCPSVMARDGDMDGLPNVILEAMATGVPVVASRLSAIPEAITDGETGLLVPPGDAEALAAAIARVLQDRALAERLIAQARRRIETDFDIRCNVAALAACFEERKTG